jgi:lipid-binding SYLF domain-containing protein
MITNPRHHHLFVVAGLLVAGLGLAGCEGTGTGNRVAASTSTGSDRSEIASEARAALQALYQQRPGARRLADEADAVLVFPSITMAGLAPVGGLYGQGAMIRNGEVTGYYNIVGGNLGPQIGAQTFSQAYFFNTPEALERFRETRGFEIGAGATVVAANYGADGEVTSATLQEPIVVTTWDQSGLMAGLTVQGAKITEINPGS